MGSPMHLDEDGHLFLIPPEAITPPNVGNVAFWLGVWGGELPPTSVGAPQSMMNWRQPWLAMDYLTAEIKTFEAKSADSTKQAERNVSEIRRLGLVLAEEKRLNTSFHKRIAELDPLVASGAKLSEISLQAIAREVWREKRRRGFRKKLSRWIQRLFGKK